MESLSLSLHPPTSPSSPPSLFSSAPVSLCIDISNNFIDQFINGIPGISMVPGNFRSNFLNNFKRRLAENFRINDTMNQFNLTSFLEEEYDTYWMVLVNAVSISNNLQLNNSQRACVIMQLRAAVNSTSRELILKSLQELRRISTSLFRIYRWYRFMFLPALSNYRPINQCVDRFITLRCAACTRNIPKLCRGVCSALIRGCFSPFQIGLRAQFNILWNVTRQIVRRGTNILQALGPLERRSSNIDLNNPAMLLQFVSSKFCLSSTRERDSEREKGREREHLSTEIFR